MTSDWIKSSYKLLSQTDSFTKRIDKQGKSYFFSKQS